MRPEERLTPSSETYRSTFANKDTPVIVDRFISDYQIHPRHWLLTAARELEMVGTFVREFQGSVSGAVVLGLRST